MILVIRHLKEHWGTEFIQDTQVNEVQNWKPLVSSEYSSCSWYSWCLYLRVTDRAVQSLGLHVYGVIQNVILKLFQLYRLIQEFLCTCMNANFFLIWTYSYKNLEDSGEGHSHNTQKSHAPSGACMCTGTFKSLSACSSSYRCTRTFESLCVFLLQLLGAQASFDCTVLWYICTLQLWTFLVVLAKMNIFFMCIW
jgi:hypothetical protein